jgi:hypothetical protein
LQLTHARHLGQANLIDLFGRRPNLKLPQHGEGLDIFASRTSRDKKALPPL